MQRRITIICIAVALLASARPACCAARAADPGRGQEPGARPAQQSRRVGVRGKITRLQPTRGRAAPDGVLGTMLVEGQKAADTEVDKALVSLTAETRLARGNETLRFTDLALGQRVEVRFAGPVRRSYPIQATAAEVVVLARGDDAAPAATGSSAPLDERGPGVSVHSLTYDPPRVPLPLMRVRVNDSEPLLFVVDTAWGLALTLNNWVGEKLKLAKTQDTVALNGSVPLQGVLVDTIQFVATQPDKNVLLRVGSAVPMGDLDLIRDGVGTTERIAGVIGAPLLARATVRFDFAAKTMALFWQPHAPIERPGATTLAMRAINADTPDFRYITLTPVPRQSAHLLIDTGATMTSLPASVTARLKPVAAYPMLFATISSLYLEERLLLGNCGSAIRWKNL